MGSCVSKKSNVQNQPASTRQTYMKEEIQTPNFRHDIVFPEDDYINSEAQIPVVKNDKYYPWDNYFSRPEILINSQQDSLIYKIKVDTNYLRIRRKLIEQRESQRKYLSRECVYFKSQPEVTYIKYKIRSGSFTPPKQKPIYSENKFFIKGQISTHRASRQI